MLYVLYKIPRKNPLFAPINKPEYNKSGREKPKVAKKTWALKFNLKLKSKRRKERITKGKFFFFAGISSSKELKYPAQKMIAAKNMKWLADNP